MKTEKRGTSWVPHVIAVSVLVIAVAAASAWHADLVYGDWTCAFAKCVRVER